MTCIAIDPGNNRVYAALESGKIQAYRLTSGFKVVAFGDPNKFEKEVPLAIGVNRDGVHVFTTPQPVGEDEEKNDDEPNWCVVKMRRTAVVNDGIRYILSKDNLAQIDH